MYLNIGEGFLLNYMENFNYNFFITITAWQQIFHPIEYFVCFLH